MQKKIIWVIVALIIIGILFLPLVDKTSGTTRVIVDHTTSEIVHPTCYDQAGLTNWIDEMSLSNAVDELEYNIIDECSKEYLAEGKTSILVRVFGD